MTKDDQGNLEDPEANLVAGADYITDGRQATVTKSDDGHTSPAHASRSREIHIPHIHIPHLEFPWSGMRAVSALRPGLSAREHWSVGVSKKLLFITYVCIITFAALVIWQLIVRRSEPHIIAWSVSAIFVGIAVPYSLHDIHMHAMHYVCPELQKYYIRCLWMVPIYSIESWLALRFKGQKIFLETAREAYEAYVIYNFLMLLINYLGGGVRVREILKEKYDAGHKYSAVLFPFCCWKWKMSGQFINRCIVGVFQYVIIRFFCAWITLIAEYAEQDVHTHSLAYDRVMEFILVVINLSQIAAMYCLVMFYHELRKELDAIYPLGKLMVVKAVVFFSFWQGLALQGLAYDGWIKPSPGYTTEDVAAGVQDFLICFEMAFAALAHKFFFSYQDMEKIMDLNTVEVLSPYQAMYDILPWDVVTEFRAQLGGGFGLVHKIRKMKANTTPTNGGNRSPTAAAGGTEGGQAPTVPDMGPEPRTEEGGGNNPV